MRLIKRALVSARKRGPAGPVGWARALPRDASLLVYRRGQFLTKLHVDGATWTLPSIERRILRDLGPGRYTLMPHYGGRLHAARHIRVRDPTGGSARDPAPLKA
ncbi:hypothetical protein HN371_19930 [Candidatus Poribacteria bacterium]|jgi:hypothetical protein|nr:hypothetical protein [Candidatus Poribacteria bacterium]MBT5535590.1 hypothetical protein [Candidatus Poribacteria bacterium]MBT5710166.1 hypothetical protein [Candidatus Poribacteria bacterium]MBT7098998.1 hypothetical protein [Candidatus Poribacteria bacterium]MBT7808060.1 hypothetical protein [Candidatus Poribacteria bacterium]